LPFFKNLFLQKKLPLKNSNTPSLMQAEHLTLNQIIEYNRNLKLPPQPTEETIYNGAFPKLTSTVPFILPPIPPYGPNGLILPTNWSAQRVLILAYSECLGIANHHIANRQITINLQKPYITVIGLEPNREGIWTHVGRTVFFHRDKPIASLDCIATYVPPARAIPGSQPSEDIGYPHPADIGPPPQN
jgi:hypothetical protein